MKKNKFQNIKWIIAIIVISLLILWPILRKGYWESDDGEWMVIRFSAFHQSLRDGHFPVRWTQRLNHEFGYPVMNFLYPLPFYLAEVPHALGFGFTSSIEIMFLFSVISSGIGMFLFAKKWGNYEGFLASALYILAPYRITLLYTRGSLGELMALACVPFIFFFIDRQERQFKIENFILASVFYAALIMSHNVIALVFSPLIIAYIIYCSKEKAIKNLLKKSSILILGLSLSAFFWIPALWEIKYTINSQIRIAVYLSHLYAASDPQLMLMAIGIMQAIFIILALFVKERFFTIAAIVSLLFIIPTAIPIYYAFPIIEKIQFPWRILNVVMFTTSCAGAIVANKLNFFDNKIKKLSLVFLLLLLFSTILPRTAEVKYTQKDDSFYSTNDDTTTVKDEFTPVWVKAKNMPRERPESPYEIRTTPNSYEIIDQEFRTGWQYLQVRLNESAQIVFNTHYFPGWKVYVDDEEVKINPQETNGLIELRVDPGRNNLRTIKVVFEKTPIRKISELISITALLIILYIFLIKTIGKKSKTKAIGFLFLIISVINIGYFVLSNLPTYRQVFVPSEVEQKYLNSQWVESDFKKAIPIGDSGLYSWAGWEYIHGKNPILINPEMPPLGKYIIGIGLLLTKRPAIVGLLLSAFALITYFFLAKLILKNNWLAIISSSLLTLEPVFRSLFNITMLDGLQIGFINLALLFFIKGLKNNRMFIYSSIMLGAAISTKFFVSTSVLIISLVGFLVISRNWKKLKFFILTLPLALSVHVLSYLNYFFQGNSFRDYLGVQKWIITFYRQGNVGTVPIGSYWLLILFNKWRIWFGQEWGKFTTIKSNLWRITWPLSVFAAFLSTVFYKRLKLSQGHGVLIVWLVVYSVFLTFIIGWPHYMLLFLPYSFILLVELGSKFIPRIIKNTK